MPRHLLNVARTAVYREGALLFVGDGHALEGDGELNGDALETSMDVAFTVELIRGKSTQAPRFKNDECLMASGTAGSLQDALQQATTKLARWLERDYKLSPNESGIVLGTSIRKPYTLRLSSENTFRKTWSPPASSPPVPWKAVRPTFVHARPSSTASCHCSPRHSHSLPAPAAVGTPASPASFPPPHVRAAECRTAPAPGAPPA